MIYDMIYGMNLRGCLSHWSTKYGVSQNPITRDMNLNLQYKRYM